MRRVGWRLRRERGPGSRAFSGSRACCDRGRADAVRRSRRTTWMKQLCPECSLDFDIEALYLLLDLRVLPCEGGFELLGRHALGGLTAVALEALHHLRRIH